MTLWLRPLLRRHLARELSRLGMHPVFGSLPLGVACDVWVNGDAGALTVSRDGGLDIRWTGSAKQLRAELQGLEDGAGALSFWRILCPTNPGVAVLVELDRVRVAEMHSVPRAALDPLTDVMAVAASRLELGDDDVVFKGNDQPERKPSWVVVDAHSQPDDNRSPTPIMGPSHWCQCSFDEALRRLRALPDNAGLAAFWEAFPNSSSKSTFQDSQRSFLRAASEHRLAGASDVPQNPPEVEVPLLIELADRMKTQNASDARMLYEMGAEDATKAWGTGNVFALAARRSVALMHAKEGNVDEACKAIDALLGDTERLAADNPELVAVIRNTRTYLYGEAGRHQQAHAFALEDERLANDQFGSDSEEAESARRNLATAEAALGSPMH